MHYRPGVTRLSFPYFMNDDVIKFVVEAVAMVAEHGWKVLPQVMIIADHVTSCDTVELLVHH